MSEPTDKAEQVRQKARDDIKAYADRMNVLMRTLLEYYGGNKVLATLNFEIAQNQATLQGLIRTLRKLDIINEPVLRNETLNVIEDMVIAFRGDMSKRSKPQPSDATYKVEDTNK